MYFIKLDTEQEVKLIYLACIEAPEDRTLVITFVI